MVEYLISSIQGLGKLFKYIFIIVLNFIRNQFFLHVCNITMYN